MSCSTLITLIIWVGATCEEWTAGTLAALEHEFPSWHLLACFDVFNLLGKADSRHGSDIETSLEKLAKAFHVQPLALQKQFTSVLPVARALQKQGSLDNRAAWATALQRTSTHTRQANRYEQTELRKAPCRMALQFLEMIPLILNIQI